MVKSILKSLPIIKMYRKVIKISTLAQFADTKEDLVDPTFEVIQHFNDYLVEAIIYGVRDDTPEWFGIEGTTDKYTYCLHFKILLLYILNTP